MKYCIKCGRLVEDNKKCCRKPDLKEVKMEVNNGTEGTN